MNILLLLLLRAWSFVVRKFRIMSSNGSVRRGFPLNEFLYLATSLLGSAALIRYAVYKLDPMTETRKQTAAKAREIEARLGAPMLGATQHELVAVELVVKPSSIDITVADIGGLDDIVEKLLTNLTAPLHCPAVFGGGLLQQPKGILLYGPPGTGKTMMAKAIAKHVNAFFLALQPSAIQNKYYGETNKAVAGIFKLARRLAAPEGSSCIIFVDEVDALLGKRRDMEHEVSLSMKTEFMSLWDGIETDAMSRIVILGATNRPQELDEAVLRRFTFSQEVPLPDVASRETIMRHHLARHCREHALGGAAVDRELLQKQPLSGLGGKRPLEWVAERTEGYSGADLHELSAEAARHSVLSVTQSLRQQIMSGSELSARTIEPSDQPALCLSDYQAALKSYQPTQKKTESFNQSSVDSSAAMANMMASFAHLARESNNYHDNHNDNEHPDHRNDLPNGNNVSL
ncbi:hypothetical protein ABBQ32_001782 [Trebouxia sp. C0010 RCD-2024]